MTNRRNTHTQATETVNDQKRVRAMARFMTGAELDRMARDYRRNEKWIIAPNGTRISRQSLEAVVEYLGCQHRLTEEVEA